MNDWQRLRQRYVSNRQYANRTTGINQSNLEEFKNFLVDQNADVLTILAQDEMTRFRLNGDLGIIYSKGSGNLLGHDMADKFKELR